MNIYEARWRNIVKQAQKVNNMLAKGYIGIEFDPDGKFPPEIVNVPFTITDTEVVQKVSEQESWFWFGNDLEFDHGMYDTIKEVNEQFATIKFYKEVKR
jgi:hypothetical protein